MLHVTAPQPLPITPSRFHIGSFHMTQKSATTEAATLARQENRTFNVKCAHALAAYGYPVARIAETIATSQRSVQRYLATPSREYDVEQETNITRLRSVDERRAALNETPFWHPDDALITQELRSVNLLCKISALLAVGMSKADVGRRLNISRRMVSYHVAKITAAA